MSGNIQLSGLKIAVLVLAALVLLGLGLGCDDPIEEHGGSDYGTTVDSSAFDTVSSVSLEQTAAFSRVLRYHDFKTLELNQKELGFLEAWFPENLVIGVRVPQTGTLSVLTGLPGQRHHLRMWVYERDTGQYVDEDQVVLVSDNSAAAQIATMFPPSSGTHWQALSPESGSTKSITETMPYTATGWLSYRIDFVGGDCNGCEVQLAFCARDAMPVVAGNLLGLQSAGNLVCADPVRTFISLYDEDVTLPVAAFGFWGGVVQASTYGPDVEIDFALSHTGSEAKTFSLGEIESEQGWDYEWYDITGATKITQIAVGTGVGQPPNLRLKGSGLPTCTLALDNIRLTATNPDFPEAVAITRVQVVPDPAMCSNTYDLAIAKSTDTVTSGQVITSGNWITYTLTITNYESIPVNAVVTDTLSPASAVDTGSMHLPAECTNSGAEITCLIHGVPTDTAKTLTIAAKISEHYDGPLRNLAVVEPANGTDGAFYDNAARVDVTVLWKDAKKIFLPLVLGSY
jgi:hypothetical protein